MGAFLSEKCLKIVPIASLLIELQQKVVILVQNAVVEKCLAVVG